MKLSIGADHGGYQLKERIKTFLSERGHDVNDVGCQSTEAVDYPDIADLVSAAIIEGISDLGILICGTGIGMSIVVNRDRRIRAALCNDEYSARMSREHNNANILCLGARVIGAGLAESIVDVWLQTGFAGGRHQQRICKYSD